MNAEQVLIPISEPAAWNEAVDKIPHGPCHTSWYNRAIAKTHGNNVFLYSYRDEQAGIVTAPLVERQFHGTRDLYSPYGNNGLLSAGGCDGFWEAHKSFMAAAGYICAHVSLNQIEPHENLIPERLREALKSVYVVDTTQNEDTLWRRFGRNNRRHLNRWRESERAEIVEDGPELETAFLEMYPGFAERIGVSDRQRLSQDTLSDIVSDKDKTKLIGVREPSGDISFVRCFLYTEGFAEAFLEASVGEGRRHSRAIYWHAFCWASAAGISSLNLSGGISPDDSLEFFKKSLGGERRTLFRARLIYDDERYDALCAEAGVASALEPGAFFPPYMEAET